MRLQLSRWERPHFRREPPRAVFFDSESALAQGNLKTSDAKELSQRADQVAAKAQQRIDARVKFIPNRKTKK